MDTLADLQAQLDKLNKARALGTREITYEANGARRTVFYKGDAEMREAQNDLRRRIGEMLAGGFRRTIHISSTKGLRAPEGSLGDPDLVYDPGPGMTNYLD
jgi:hypothetical protein